MALYEGRKRRWGDRKDGFLIKTLPPMDLLIPYIMKDKVDSWVLFDERVDITEAEALVKRMNKEELPGLSLFHLVFAATVRAVSQVPQINRFVVNNRVYARNEIKFAMVVKKGMNIDGDRTTILPFFNPEDTLYEVYNSIQKEITKIDRTVNVAEDTNKTGFDTLQWTLSIMPHWLLKAVIGLLKKLDRHGMIPKKITDLSPFHTTCFYTNMGSFGMESVHHHIYEFGTLSMFGAIGKKETEVTYDKDGNKVRKSYIRFKYVIDERTCGGFEYGEAFKIIKHCMVHPDQLLEPPKKVVLDNIDRPKKAKKK